MTSHSRRLAAASGLLALLTILPGCASSPMKQARIADELRQYDVAVAQYMKAVKDDPSNREAYLGLERAKLRAAEAHLFRGRRLQSQGHIEDALLELQVAAELNPTSADIDRELRAARLALRNKLATPPEGQTALQTLFNSSRDLAPVGFELPDIRLPNITASRTTTSREAYLMIASIIDPARLSVSFDSAFRDGPAQLGVLNAPTLKQALDAVASSSNTFYRVIGPNEIIVVNNTPAKVREYQEEFVRAFPVQNAQMKDAMDALRIVGDIRSIAPIASLNVILLRDTADRVRAAGRVLASFDKAPPEVVVDVEILEINRTDLQEYGLQLATPPGTAGISGSIETNRDDLTLQNLRSLSAGDFLTSAIPALYYRLLKTAGNTRTLANPHVRMMDGIPAVAKFGEEFPVPKVVISPITQGGLNIQPQTTFDYRTVGVNITLTPRTHANDDVTLALSIELSSLSGTGFEGLPTFGSRTVQTTIRLRDGETNILAGLIRDDQRTERQSIPGLGKVPVLGTMLFAKNRKEASQTDVVIMLTPHIIRPLDMTVEDLRPVRMPREGSGASLLESVPTVPPPPVIRDGAAPAPVVPAPVAPMPPSLPVVSGVPQGVPLTTAAPIKPPPPVIKRR